MEFRYKCWIFIACLVPYHVNEGLKPCLQPNTIINYPIAIPHWERDWHPIPALDWGVHTTGPRIGGSTGIGIGIPLRPWLGLAYHWN